MLSFIIAIIAFFVFFLFSHCDAAAVFTFTMHHRFSDPVRKWSTVAAGIPSAEAERWPEKGTVEYYAELADRDRFSSSDASCRRLTMDSLSLTATQPSASAPSDYIFGGKGFATYVQAKRIVKFITDVAATVNHDPEIEDLLKVVFVPDYNVSVAEVLIPGSELSQHISTAGMEASETSNMKFAMNGCILIGTLDGANVEIREEVGEDNFFLFGARAHEIAGLRKERAEGKFVVDPRFEEVKAYVRSGVFGTYNYEELMGSLEGNEGYGLADYFLAGKDFPSYLECQDAVDNAYRDQKVARILLFVYMFYHVYLHFDQTTTKSVAVGFGISTHEQVKQSQTLEGEEPEENLGANTIGAKSALVVICGCVCSFC